MSSSILTSTALDFKASGVTQCKLTASASTFTFTGVSSARVTVDGIETPVSDYNAANKSYVDSVAAGLAWKDSVVAATTESGTLATSFQNTSVIDGVTLSTGDRILIKNQTNGIENGIYIVAASGAPTRAVDMSTNYDASSDAVFVEQGTVNADSGWTCTNNTGSAVVGTDALVFVQFSGAGQVIAGDGLSKTGNTISVDSTVVRTSGDQTIAGLKTLQNKLTITDTTSSTSTSTGCAVLSGGLGVSQNVNVGGTTTIAGVTSVTNITGSTSTSTGCAVLSGGLGVAENVHVGGTATIAGTTSIAGVVSVTDTTGSTNTSTGCVVLSGGLGVAEKAYFGSDVYGLSFNSTSDMTLKTNIQNISDPLEKLKRIDGYSYNWKNGDPNMQYGVMAQQLESVGFSDIVNTNKDGIKGVNYNALIPFLIESVKSLSKEVDRLKKQNSLRERIRESRQ